MIKSTYSMAKKNIAHQKGGRHCRSSSCAVASTWTLL